MIQTSRTYANSVDMRVLTEDQIWEIRQAAFEVIEKSGFKCLHAEARKMLAAAGAVDCRVGRVAEEEMFRTFNMGIGMVVVVGAAKAAAVLRSLRGSGHSAWTIGEVVPGRGRVLLR